MPPAPVTLRAFFPEDVEAVLALFRGAVWRVNIRDYSLEQVRAWAPENIDPVALGRRLEDSYCVVAEAGDTLAGFANLEDSGHVDCLYVHADFQRQGIGSQLLRDLESRAVAGGMSRLFTEASLTAVPFFEAHGYCLIERQQVAVRGVELTNCRMEKSL